MNKIFALVLLLSIVLSKSFSQDTLRLRTYVGELKQITISIEGKTYQFLFDTGGGETFISPSICSSLNKIPHGKEFGYRMNGERIHYQKCDSVTIEMGATKIFHSAVGVWDVMGILPKELPKIDGIISLKSFQNKIICLDLTHNIIIIETNKSTNKKTKEMTLLKSRFANGLTGNELIVFLGAKHNNVLYWFLFDSGNLDSFIFSPLTAYEWEIQSDSVSVGKTYTTDIALGEESEKTEVVTKEIIYDGSLNYGFISKNIYLLDMIKNRVWTK
jgi:hypothetical protein